MFYLIFILSIFTAKSNDGNYYLNKGLVNKDNLQIAELNFKTAVELFKQENKKSDFAQTYYYLGYVNELNTNYDAAIYYFNQSLIYIDKSKEKELLFKTYERLTTIYIFINLYSDANRYLLKNSDIISSNTLDSSFIFRHLYTEALYYYYVKEFGNAYHSLNQIDVNQIESFDLEYYNLFALIFTSTKDFNSAYKMYSILYDKDSSDKTYVLNFTAFLYEFDESKKADELYNKYLKLKDNEIYQTRMINYILHSDVLCYRQEYDKSLLLLDSIKPFFEENKMYSRIAECLEIYKRNYQKLKKYDEYEATVDELIKVKDKQFNNQLEIVNKINDSLFELEKENLELNKQNEIYTITTYSVIAIIVLALFVVILAFVKRRKTNEYKLKIKQIDAENKILKDILDNDFNNALDTYNETIYSNLDVNKDSKVFTDFDRFVKIKKQINEFLSKRNQNI